MKNYFIFSGKQQMKMQIINPPLSLKLYLREAAVASFLKHLTSLGQRRYKRVLFVCRL